MTITQGQLNALRASFNSASEEKVVMQDSLIAAKDEIQRLRSVEHAASTERQRALHITLQVEELSHAKITLQAQLARAIEENERLSAEVKEAVGVARAANDRAVSDAAAAAVMRQREEKAASELVTVRRQVVAIMLFISGCSTIML